MPTIPAPQARWRRVFGNVALYDILIAIAALVNALLTLRRGSRALIVVACFIMALAVIKAVLQWRQKDAQDSPHELEGCLYTLHDILTAGCPDDPGLRITVHVPRGDGKTLVQALGYVGSQRKRGTAGRLTPISCGITGRAFRTERPVRLRRANDDINAYVRDLVEAQGFTDAQARSVDPATMAGYAFPLIGQDGAVEGIVYADAVAQDFFTDARIADIDSACGGIARFIERKYAV